MGQNSNAAEFQGIGGTGGGDTGFDLFSGSR